MRLDVFLKLSRLCPGRSVAQKFCEAGRVFVNGRAAKSSHVVKPGDEIQIQRHNRVITGRVLVVPAAKQVARKDAAGLYELVKDEVISEDDF